jgi:cytochrome c1
MEQLDLPERRDAARSRRALGHEPLAVAQFKGHEEAQAAALAGKGIVSLEPGKDHTWVVKTLTVETPGALSPAQYREMVADLVNFLTYMAEPTKNKRVSLGLIVLLYLCVLFGFAYWMKREYWKDVH